MVYRAEPLHRMAEAVARGAVLPAGLQVLRKHANKIIQSPASGSNGKDLYSAANGLMDAIIARQLLTKRSLAVEIPGQRSLLLLNNESLNVFSGSSRINVGTLAAPASVYGIVFPADTIITFDHEGKPTHARLASDFTFGENTYPLGSEFYLGELRSDAPQLNIRTTQPTRFTFANGHLDLPADLDLAISPKGAFQSALLNNSGSLFGQQYSHGTRLAYEADKKRFVVALPSDHQLEVDGQVTTCSKDNPLYINESGQIVPDPEATALQQQRAAFLSLLDKRPTGSPAAEQEIAALRRQVAELQAARKAAAKELATAQQQAAELQAALKTAEARPSAAIENLVEMVATQVTALQARWLEIDKAIADLELNKAELTVKYQGNEEAAAALQLLLGQQIKQFDEQLVKAEEEHQQALAKNIVIRECRNQIEALESKLSSGFSPAENHLLQLQLDQKIKLLKQLTASADRKLQSDLSRLEAEKKRTVRQLTISINGFAAVNAAISGQLVTREEKLAKKTEERAGVGRELNGLVGLLSSAMNVVNAALNATGHRT